MKAVAEEVPELDLKSWEDARDAPSIARLVKADATLATELRLPAAPAAVVDGPHGTRKLIESPSVGDIERAVDQVG